MGLFSSKHETHVATSVVRVIEDKALPHSIKTGALKSLIENDDQMIESAMEELTTSIGVKANMMYSYGRDHYMNGLPTSSYQTPLSGEQLIKSTIEQTVGPITIDYYYFGMLNTLHVGWVKLMELYSYNPTTNTLIVGGITVYLEDMVVVVKEASLTELQNGALDQWGTPPTAGVTPERVAFPTLAKYTPWEANALVSNDYVRVHYGWLNSVSVMQHGTFNINITGFDETASYHHVKYKKADNSYGYWLYKANAGTYNAIDKLHTPEWTTGGTYFPWSYFRFAKKSLSEHMEETESKQMAKLTKYLGMDFNAVGDAINENPDIANIENAFLMMAVPAATTNQVEMRYLFDYFDGLYSLSGGSLEPSKQLSNATGLIIDYISNNLLDPVIIIQDNKFKMALGFRKIYKTHVAGVIAEEAGYTTEHGKKTITSTGANDAVFTTQVNFHIYRKQISDSAYEEIEVQNLKVKYYVYQDYTVVGNDEDENLLIPLDKSIADSYSVPVREILYSRSLHYIFNSRIVVEVKWYQQGWFRTVMLIVAVVITAFSFGQTWQLIVAAVAIGATAVAIAMIFIVKILEQLILALIIKLFVKIVGVKLAFLVAIVAVIYGGTTAIEAGSIKGAPWASDLLALGSGLAKEIGSVLKDDFNSLANEIEEYSDYTKSKQEKLEAAQNDLGFNNYLAPTVVFGESPNEFYDRTVHSGNIGVLALDAVTSFVDVALTLPKRLQTTEDSYEYA